MSTLMHVNIHPVGDSESVNAAVTKVVDTIRNSGMPHDVGAMGTTVEGEWRPCLDLLDKCRKSLAQHKRLRIEASFDVRDTDEKDRLHKQAQKAES